MSVLMAGLYNYSPVLPAAVYSSTEEAEQAIRDWCKNLLDSYSLNKKIDEITGVITYVLTCSITGWNRIKFIISSSK